MSHSSDQIEIKRILLQRYRANHEVLAEFPQVILHLIVLQYLFRPYLLIDTSKKLYCASCIKFFRCVKQTQRFLINNRDWIRQSKRWIDSDRTEMPTDIRTTHDV